MFKKSWMLCLSALTTGMVVSFGGAAAADELVRCGGEGERPCGVTNATFWDNGTGFCDAGLKATGFHVLPDIPAFRGNAWVNTSGTSVQPLRKIIFQAQEVQRAFNNIDAGDWSLGEIGRTPRICVDIPFVGEECTPSLPIYGPKVGDAILSFANAVKSLGEFVAVLVPEGFKILLPIATGESFTITPNVPFDAPRLSFDPFDFIDGDDFGGFLRNFVSNAFGYVQRVIDSVEGLVKDFDNPPGRCVNHIRHNWDSEVHVRADGSHGRNGFGALLRGDGTGDVTEMQGTWAYWALERQRLGLGIDEPLNWIQHIDTHNAYNNSADGFIIPNQRYSLSDQLDLGVRSLELDPNVVGGKLRVCHGKENDVGCSVFDRLFDNTMKEIRNWLDDNPNEVIILRMEDYVDGAADTRLLVDSVAARLGGRVYTQSNAPGPQSQATEWPSIRDLLNPNKTGGKKQVLIFTYRDSANRSNLFWHNPVVEKSGTDFFASDNQGICEPDFMRIDNPTYLNAEYRNRTWYTQNTNNKLGLLDRSFFGYNEVIRLTESRPLLESATADPDEVAQFLNEAEVAYLSRCAATIISMDFMNGKEETSLDACEYAQASLPSCRSVDNRVRAMVWSWAEGDFAQHGDAAYLDGASRAWRSGRETDQRRFACALPREKGDDGWLDAEGRNWKITDASGSWREGGLLCYEEFGEDSYTFSVPRNGWQNERLLEALEEAGAGSVWLNVNDFRTESVPVINRRPIADFRLFANQALPILEGDDVRFDARSSYDLDGDSLNWSYRFGDGTETDFDGSPIGVHAYGDNDVYTARVLVRDEFGALNVAQMEIEPLNVAPSLTLEPPNDETGAIIGEEVGAALIGLGVTVAGSFTDPGYLDTHSATIDWGDGDVTEYASVIDTIEDVHAFRAAGEYTVTVTVTDDDGGVDVQTTTVLVLDTNGAIDYIEDVLLNSGLDHQPTRGWLFAARTKFNQGRPLSGMLQLRRALAELEVLERENEVNLVPLKNLTALIAKSELVQSFETYASRTNALKMAMAMAHIEQGDALLAEGSYVATIDAWSDAFRAAFWR